MPVLRPFVGTRFSAEAGDLNALLFPGDGGPREVFVDRSPNNIAHAAIPEGKPDDRSRYIRYARSNAAIFEWQRGGLIQACDDASTYQLLLNDAWLALGLIELDAAGVEAFGSDPHGVSSDGFAGSGAGPGSVGSRSRYRRDGRV